MQNAQSGCTYAWQPQGSKGNVFFTLDVVNQPLYVEVQAYCLASQPGPLTGLRRWNLCDVSIFDVEVFLFLRVDRRMWRKHILVCNYFRKFFIISSEECVTSGCIFVGKLTDVYFMISQVIG